MSMVSTLVTMASAANHVPIASCGVPYERVIHSAFLKRCGAPQVESCCSISMSLLLAFNTFQHTG